MNKISRHIFLKRSLNIGAAAMLSPLSGELFARSGAYILGNNESDDSIFQRLVKSNDQQVEELLKNKDDEIPRYTRKLGYQFGILSASYCTSSSKYHHSVDVAGYLNKIARFLLHVQRPDGTVNAGNLESPPDTAFVIELLCAGTVVLMEDDSKALDDAKSNIKQFILKAGDALTTGGVHTANHRWVISSALARINQLYPNKKYVDRINDWLGEGIYNDEDGHFQERSRNYSEVVDRALITIGRLQNMPELFEPVRNNLRMNYYYMEPNGDLVTVDSRRQDQYGSKHMVAYYLHYRYMAIRDNDGEFAAITRLIEQFDSFEEEILSIALIDFMEMPILQKQLPKSSPLQDNYEKFLETTALSRIRRGAITTTIFGGVDWPLIIASGRSTSPDFFSYRKGTAILKYMRLSLGFFSMGYFRSEGLKKEGNKYILHKTWEVPYYQPLPQDKRKADGNYDLSPSIDDRFWNKMSFSDRPTSNIKTLTTTITIKENNGKNELKFEVTGHDSVPVTMELCFAQGGKLTGVTNSEDPDENYLLERGMGTYQFGGDTIRFGPGTVSHKYISGLEGEKYSSHNGSLRTDGMHVYLTGTTPFEHTLTIG